MGKTDKVGRFCRAGRFGSFAGEESPDRTGHPAAESADRSNLMEP